MKRVFVSGFFDMLNSGQVQFLKEAAEYGDLYVGVGSDSTFKELKGRRPVCSERERLYMVRALRHVKDAFINTGSGVLDFIAELDRVRPDVFVVNLDGGNELKRKVCEERGIDFVSIGASRSIGALGTVSAAGPRYDCNCEDNIARSVNTDPKDPILRARRVNTAKPIPSGAPILSRCRLPYRIDIAGTWIDQPYVSEHGAGWAITASIEPTYGFMERGGMSTSTRNAAKRIWPVELP
ncbi:MAG: adenylyltransferase/cytidyltransferase family protein, partial [Muribaculaceae bacterium]|nr:adenylyltransferase/cytidyltransferase family protein [Muribaculaceae bacterium]